MPPTLKRVPSFWTFRCLEFLNEHTTGGAHFFLIVFGEISSEKFQQYSEINLQAKSKVTFIRNCHYATPLIKDVRPKKSVFLSDPILNKGRSIDNRTAGIDHEDPTAGEAFVTLFVCLFQRRSRHGLLTVECRKWHASCYLANTCRSRREGSRTTLSFCRVGDRY